MVPSSEKVWHVWDWERVEEKWRLLWLSLMVEEWELWDLWKLWDWEEWLLVWLSSVALVLWEEEFRDILLNLTEWAFLSEETLVDGLQWALLWVLSWNLVHLGVNVFFHLMEGHLLNWAGVAPGSLESLHVGHHGCTSLRNGSKVSEEMLITITFVVVDNDVEDLGEFTEDLESVINDSVSHTFVVDAGLEVIHAPGVFVVDVSVGITVLNVVEDHIPSVVGGILELLVVDVPDVTLVEFTVNALHWHSFLIHPVSQAHLVKWVSSSVVVGSLDDCVTHGVDSFSGKSVEWVHLGLISAWAGFMVWSEEGHDWAFMVMTVVVLSFVGRNGAKSGDGKCEFHIKY